MAHAFKGEVLGTFILVLFGCGSVITAVTLDAQVGIYQIAIVWGLGLSVAIFLTAQLSGAHFNPAITIAFALTTEFPWKRVPAYIFAQFIGAFIAAAVLYAVFGTAIETFEQANDIIRGQIGSEKSARIFGEFFTETPGNDDLIRAFLAEALGTAILAMAIYGYINKANKTNPGPLTPFAIGLTLTALISLLAPISQGGFNPARDLAPRIFSSIVGWGDIPFTANGHAWLTVYIIAPIIGATCGALLMTKVIYPAYQATTK